MLGISGWAGSATVFRNAQSQNIPDVSWFADTPGNTHFQAINRFVDTFTCILTAACTFRKNLICGTLTRFCDWALLAWNALECVRIANKPWFAGTPFLTAFHLGLRPATSFAETATAFRVNFVKRTVVFAQRQTAAG